MPPESPRSWPSGDAQRSSAWPAQLAERAVAIHEERNSSAARRHSPDAEKLRHETLRHLVYLAEALRHDEPELFADYCVWWRDHLDALRADPGDLADQLGVLAEAAADALAPPLLEPVRRCLQTGTEAISTRAPEMASHLIPSAPLAALARAYLDDLLAVRRRDAVSRVIRAADEGTPIQELYLYVFQPVQREVGLLWQRNRISVAVEHYCTAATQLAMAQLYPRIIETPRDGPTLVAVGVGGDLHELGIRMVSDFFEIAGWSSIYLGTDVPAGEVVEALFENDARLLAVSATAGAQVSGVRDLIACVREHEGGSGVQVLVGGPPFFSYKDLYQRVGADGTAPDAPAAVDLGRRLLDQGHPA